MTEKRESVSTVARVLFFLLVLLLVIQPDKFIPNETLYVIQLEYLLLQEEQLKDQNLFI